MFTLNSVRAFGVFQKLETSVQSQYVLKIALHLTFSTRFLYTLIFKMAIKFPNEKSTAIDRFKTDPFLGDIMQSGLTGYLKCSAGDIGGLVVFDKGDITAAYFTNKGQIVSSGVTALLSLKYICEDDQFEFFFAEVPQEFIHLVDTLHLGRQMVPETDTNILNFQNLYSSYQGRIETGLLVIQSVGGDVGLISINQGKWQYLTSKDKFNELFTNTGSRLSLYEKPKIPETSRDAETFSKKTSVNVGERIKEVLVTNFRQNFGSTVEGLVEEFSRKEFNTNNYEEELVRGIEYLKLFIDEKEAKPFVEKLEKQIKKIISEVTT